MSKPFVIGPQDFGFDFGPDVHINATPLGEDDYLAAYGHSITVSELVDEAIKYFKAADAFADEEEYRDLEESYKRDGIRRVWAQAFTNTGYEDEWYLSWNDVSPDAENAIPITLLRLQ